MFHETSNYGTLWYRHGELPWLKWFAFGWWFRSVTFSVVVSVVFAGLLLAVVWLVGADGLADGRLDFGLVLLGCAATAVITLVVPTIVSKLVISNLFENDEYRFGPMLGEGSWRYKTLAPSLAVIRVYEGAVGSFDKLSDGTREVINEWLLSTWDVDYEVWKASSGFGYVRDGRRYWRAIDDRVNDFLALPIANEPAVRRLLLELSQQQYLLAYTDGGVHVAKVEAAMLDGISHYQRAAQELAEFAAEAPGGVVLPKASISTIEAPGGTLVVRVHPD